MKTATPLSKVAATVDRVASRLGVHFSDQVRDSAGVPRGNRSAGTRETKVFPVMVGQKDTRTGGRVEPPARRPPGGQKPG